MQPISHYFDTESISVLRSISDKYGTRKKYAKGDVLLEFSSKATVFGLILSGFIKYTIIDDDGNELVEEFITANNFWGDITADNKETV